MGIKISVQMAIMSHLSDAQELLSMALNLERAADEANMEINFAKHLLLKYPDTSVELSNEELNDEWHEVIK